MDDIIKIIIWLVIIYSFAKPFFKKKETPKPPLPGTNPRTSTQFPKEQSNVDLSQVAQKKGEYDILKEIENLFKDEIKTPGRTKQTQVEEYSEYKSHEIKDKDLDLIEDKRLQRNIEDRTPIGSRETYDQKMANRKAQLEQQRQARIVDPKIEETAKQFERVLAGPRKQRAAITDFNRKLKNPATVREYILFSEILGKPKALRR